MVSRHAPHYSPTSIPPICKTTSKSRLKRENSGTTIGSMKPKKNYPVLIFVILLLVLMIVLAIVVPQNKIKRQKPEPTKPTTTKPAGVKLSTIDTDYYHGKVIGHITCRRIGLDCDLVYGTTDDDLWKGAGLHEFSSLPGFATTPLIAGHARLCFKGFANAKKGDEITITMPYGTYLYRIRESKVMNRNDFDFNQLNEHNNEAIFYACYPFYKTDYVKQNRIFFYCDLVSGPKVIDDVHGTHAQATSPNNGNGDLAHFS